jgi:hypothetical protein
VAPVTLTVVRDELEAEVVCGMLRTNGINCGHRRSDVAAGAAAYGGGSSIAGPIEIVVDEADVAAAKKLLPS